MRKKPYTERGLKRIPCFRCKASSDYQWQICADGNQYRGVCYKCDIELNRTVLLFMGDPEADEKMERYVLRVAREV
jgi:hypothetical protein